MSLFEISSFQGIESLWNNNQMETLNLEFKQTITSRSEEVAKDISSFANAEGGVIIYGVSETDGRAIKSTGIKTGKNSERIQQIVSSSTAPEVPMTIDVIVSPADPTSEFLVVKIPKSPFYIHQVTTTGKFYIRNNTTTKQHEYNPIELKENDIALRYQARFQNRLAAESFVEEKIKRIYRNLGYRNWHTGLVLSVVPHVRIPNAVKLSEQDFRSYFINKNNIVTYDNLPTTTSVPSIDGRHSDYQTVTRFFVEIDKDRSIFYCRANQSDARIEIFDPIFMIGELLHITNRVMKKTSHYGGMTFRLYLTGGLNNASQVKGITLYQSESDFSFDHELPPAPFDMKAEMSKLFEKYFEALHVDNSLTRYPKTIPRIQELWREYDKRSWEIS